MEKRTPNLSKKPSRIEEKKHGKNILSVSQNGKHKNFTVKYFQLYN